MFPQRLFFENRIGLRKKRNKRKKGGGALRLSAEGLLRNYPAWWRWLQRLNEDPAEDAAWSGYSAEHQARDTPGPPSDPTFRRALKLATVNELKKAVEETAAFIDELKREEEQRVLVATWRMGSFGPGWVARSAGLSVAEALTTWAEMVRRLEVRLYGEGVNLLAVRTGDVRMPLPNDTEGGENQDGN